VGLVAGVKLLLRENSWLRFGCGYWPYNSLWRMFVFWFNKIKLQATAVSTVVFLFQEVYIW
jgi:hypothetical protein